MHWTPTVHDSGNHFVKGSKTEEGVTVNQLLLELCDKHGVIAKAGRAGAKVAWDNVKADMVETIPWLVHTLLPHTQWQYTMYFSSTHITVKWAASKK